jgi:hypothetical protein
MLGMLHPVGLDHFDLVPDLNREVHAIYCITLLDLFQDTRIPGGEPGRFVKTFFYGFKELVLVLYCHNS